MEQEKIKNIIKDTRKGIRYILLANRKLTRDEMLYQIKIFNFDPMNIKQKSGTEVVIEVND